MDRTRDPILLVAAILALGVAVAGGLSSSAWVGKAFPGFLLLENHVVASAGLAHWPAVAGGAIYQLEVVRVDGIRLTTPAQLRTHVESLPVESEVVYRLRSGEREIERRIETRTFGWVDFALLSDR